jgi:hypothetical protein
MINDKKIQELIDRSKKMEHGEKLDLSSAQDLSIAVMNLISIEEHLFFSGGKTGKVKYYDLLNEVREMRKQLLKMLIKDYEGEGWCIGKHLLAASMRLMEVGTKMQTKGEDKKAYDLFKKAYDLYNLFWGINLGVVKPGELKNMKFEKEDRPVEHKESVLGKLGSVIGNILDCCKE